MDVASLGLGVRNEQVDEATTSLKAFTASATAADKAAAKIVSTSEAAGKSSEQFSARVKRSIDLLEFQTAQLGRSSAEQERYSVLRRAGASAESAAGDAITRNVQALQAQRAERQKATEAAEAATAAAREVQQQAAESARIAAQQSASINKVVADLEHERAQLARTTAERAQYDAIRRAGVSAASVEGKAIMTTVAALEAERVALRNAEIARMQALKMTTTRKTGLTAQDKLVLSYQINDIFTSVMGGMSPLMIAAQQGPQITQIFGGLRATLAAIPKGGLIAGGSLAAVGITAAVLHSIAKMNDELAEQQRRLTTLLGSQTEASRAYGDIAKFASAAGISMETATESFVAFVRAGQNLGATRAQAGSIASSAEKLSQLSGASPTEGAAAQGALAGMLKEATVNADQLKTVLSSVPQIGEQIAAGLGVSVTQLRLMAQQGELTNRQVFDSLLKQGKAVDEQFGQMPKSVGRTFQSLADDLWQVTQRFIHLIPLVREYRLLLELAAKGAKLLKEETTPATPAERMAKAGGPTVYSDATNRIMRRGAEPSAFYGAQFDQAIADNQETFAAVAAAAKAAGEEIVRAAATADKFDPLGKAIRESNRDIAEMEKALRLLESGLSGLSAEEAAQQMGTLANAIDRAKKAALEIDPALKALNEVTLRGNIRAGGGTAADVALEARTRELMVGGSNMENAKTAALAEQKEKIDEIVKAKQDEARAAEMVTAATGKGKNALIEAQVEAARLAFIMQNVGKNTDVYAKELEDYLKAFRKVLTEGAAQQTASALKALEDELYGIVAAQDAVTQGAYAMRRAQAQAKADRDQSGTGAAQMVVFDQQQLLADMILIENLTKQVELTNKLADAAGDVAKQKKLQLDFDIARAREAAVPASEDDIDAKMRAKAAADRRRDYGEIIAQSKDFVEQQEIERQAAFLSTEAAAALRFEYQLLNQARQRGIEMTPDVVAGFKASAAAMAESQERARRTNELMTLGKDALGGFAQEMAQGLRNGALMWDTFGNAAMNALNKIADKLLQMAVEDLFTQAFGKAGSAGGGFLGSLLGSLFGASASSAGGVVGPGTGYTYAMGGAFDRGNVIPFARGGIVHRPTLFPFAKGTGLMGEAGPEAIVPLRRGRNGRLGVDASGGGGGDVYVNIVNTTDSTVTARKSKTSGGEMQLDIVVAAVEGMMSGRLSRGQGALGKTMEGTYGLQRVGR